MLYRLSAQSRLLVEAFERSGIPYQTVGQSAALRAQGGARGAGVSVAAAQPGDHACTWQTVLAAGKPAFSAKVVDGWLTDDPDTPEDATERIARLDQACGPPRRPASFTAAQRATADGPRRVLPAARAGSHAARRSPDRAQSSQFIAAGRGEPWSDADAGRLSQLTLRAAPYEDRLADFLERLSWAAKPTPTIPAPIAWR